MSKPICQDLRAGGPDNDWQDTPCGRPATAEYSGRPVCQDHLKAAERREVEAIAESFFAGVPLEEVRRIADAGGLKGLLASHARLVKASETVLPYLANHSMVSAHTFRTFTAARHEALPFLSREPS